MEKLKYTSYLWYLGDYNDYDGAVMSYSNDGLDVCIVDQYWANCGHGVDDEEEQISNMSLIVNAPLMYETIHAYLEGSVDKDRLLQVIEKVNDEGIVR